MSSHAQSTKPAALGIKEVATELVSGKEALDPAALPQVPEERTPTFDETYPRYEFAPLVRLTLYLVDESTIRRHAAYLWAFLVASAGAAAVLLGISGPVSDSK